MANEAAKKAADEANLTQNTDWRTYFASIVGVCPWSQAYWKKHRIDIVDWNGDIQPLGKYAARIYQYPQASAYKLNKLMKKFNEERDDEEWLYSHPKFGGHSTPMPCLIQQDYNMLAQARQSLKQHKYKSKQSQ